LPSAKEPDAATLRSRRHTCKTLEHDRDAARDDVVDRHRRAGGVHERHVYLSLVAHQLAGQMRLATAIGGGEQHSILRAVDELDQLGDAGGLDVLVDAHRNRLLADHADGRERLVQIDRHLVTLLDRQDGPGRSLRHVDRIAVLRQRGRGLGRDQSAGARAVDHHDLLLPKLCQLVGDDTGHHVRTVAGGGRGDELHRLVGIILGLRGGA